VTRGVRLVEGDGGIVRLAWEPGLAPEDLQTAVTEATERALTAGARRVEVAVPAADRWARRAVLRSGFRQEGVRRAVVPLANGAFDDLVLLSRLPDDRVGGPHGFSSVMNTVLPRKRLIAHVLMRDADDRILLCDTAFKTDWELPGGIVEPGEPPRDAAIREVREELGIDLDVGRLLLTDWLPPYLGWDDAVEMIFDGGRVTERQLATFSLQENEIRRVELVTLAVAATLVTPLSHRRLSVAVGQSGGETAYLEDGRRV
jgi:8-oxo-dGTP pyrophosphatase MutT (NUDIX family)